MPEGFVAPGYEAVLAATRDLEAQVAAYVDDRLVVDVGDQALRPVYSSTKGILAAVIGLLIDERAIDLDVPVVSVWPEFGMAGKAAITIRQAMSHQGGLAFLKGGLSEDDLLDHDRLAARVAEQHPLWEPGSGFAYHGITIGTIGDELTRRTVGRSVAELFSEHFAEEGELFLGAGAPGDVASVPGPTDEDMRAWVQLRRPPEPGTLAAGAAAAAAAEPPMFEFVQTAAFRATGQPAAAAVGSARGLATFYARLPSRISEPTLAQLTAEQVRGTDLILCRDSRFGVVFQLPSPTVALRGFGHPGGGGSVAFRDGRLAFGFVPTRFPGIGQEDRLRKVIAAISTAAGLPADDPCANI